MTPSCRIFAIIVAGGRGLRMKADRPKQFLELNGEPILTRTIRVFTQSGIVDEVVLVLPSDEMDYCSEHVLTPFGLDPEVHLVNGGVLRQDSVKNGLEFIRTQFDSPGNDVVMIHDGVRPLVTDRILERGIEAVQETGAAIPAIPVAETVKRSSRDQCVLETIDRQSLYLAQTPQV
ncbi:MAG: 2-C-methyl-D-erythritol 4-phosphate cytidylyltransferase, partial [Desulfobacteraceae bacterium]